MADTGSNKDLTVDLGEELLHVPALWDFFIEKTVIDAKHWFASRISSPPWGVLIAFIAATIFFGYLKSLIAILSGLFALGLFVWIILVRNSNTQNSIESIISSINNGTFPPEIKDSITKRLRWWSALIVPSEWTRNSKIFSVRNKLIERLSELDQELKYWKSPIGAERLNEIRENEELARIRHEDYKKKLNLLKSRGVNVDDSELVVNEDGSEMVTERFSDPQVLIKLLRSRGDCNRQLERISQIIDPIERASEEIVLVQALLLHCNKIISMIEEIDTLSVAIETIKVDNLNEKVREIIDVLERRRIIVGKLNRISPKRVLGLVDYNPLMAQSEISHGRDVNGKKQ